jgi:hypothetical protein
VGNGDVAVDAVDTEYENGVADVLAVRVHFGGRWRHR